MSKGSKTAAELMAELEADREYVADRRQRDAELERNKAQWRQAELPLIEALRAAGFQIDSAWDLVNTSTPYPTALPILLEHLQRPYPGRVREGIARALAVRDARFAWPTLARLYREEPTDGEARDGLAVALSAASDGDVIDELIALAGNEAHGESRILLLRALKRSGAPQARAALEQFSRDPVLGQEARALLRGCDG
jgi:HEAT repeat protein